MKKKAYDIPFTGAIVVLRKEWHLLHSIGSQARSKAGLSSSAKRREGALMGLEKAGFHSPESTRGRKKRIRQLCREIDKLSREANKARCNELLGSEKARLGQAERSQSKNKFARRIESG